MFSIPRWMCKLTEFNTRLALTTAVLLFFSVSFFVYVEAERAIDEANHVRLQSFLLADELRQSSDDLTRMVRMYAITGESRYREHFHEILAIRNGDAPRPENYHLIYWDLVDASNQRPRPFAEHSALLDRMHNLGFTDLEVSQLVSAKQASDDLATIEQDAMRLVATGDPLLKMQAVTILHDETYHQAKSGIMQPIDQLYIMMDARTNAVVSQAEKLAWRLQMVFILLGVMLALLLWQLKRHDLSILGAPVTELYQRIIALGHGDFSTEIETPRGKENTVLGWLAQTRSRLYDLDHAQQMSQQRLKKESNRLCHALDQLRLLNQAVEQSPESIIITDLQGRILYMNPMFASMTGYKHHEMVGKNPRILQSGETPATTYKEMWQSLSAGKIWCGELSNKRKSGEVYPAHTIISPVKDESGEVTHFLAIQRDLLEEKLREQRFQDLLYLDELTGIANRNKLLETMDRCLNRHPLLPVNGCLLLLNMTHFRFVNQLHGEEVGDALLNAVGQRLQQAFEGQGQVARLVADEFAVFCDNQAEFEHVDDWLTIMGQKALTTLSSALEVKGESFTLDFAIGVAPLRQADSMSSSGAIHQTLRFSEIALRQARQQETNRLVIYNHAFSEQVQEELQLQKDLAHAIKSEQLRLFVQPQVLHDGKLVGLECLVRWQHPEKGLLTPVSFIPLAEQSDLIVALGDWVLAKACRLLADIQVFSPDITLSVNISPRHFRQKDFVERLASLLSASDVAPNALIIEITESLFLDNFDEVVQKMRSLKTLGVLFSIDDFGTGYSSLSYLQHLPVDEVKIDRAFVLAMDEYGMDRSLVSSIYAMAQQMHLAVVVEGVETEQQLDRLSVLKHIRIQGFLFAKPQDYQIWHTQWLDEKNLNR